MVPATSEAELPKVAKDIAHYMRPGLLQLAALPPLSLYVHLPWCLKKCPYCDFNSHEAPSTASSGVTKVGGLSVELEQRYVDALIAD